MFVLAGAAAAILIAAAIWVVLKDYLGRRRLIAYLTTRGFKDADSRCALTGLSAARWYAGETAPGKAGWVVVGLGKTADSGRSPWIGFYWARSTPVTGPVLAQWRDHGERKPEIAERMPNGEVVVIWRAAHRVEELEALFREIERGFT